MAYLFEIVDKDVRLLYLWHLWPGFLVLLLSFGLQDDLLRIQTSDESVGLELGALLVAGHQLQGVARGVQAILCAERHQQVHQGFAAEQIGRG